MDTYEETVEDVADDAMNQYEVIDSKKRIKRGQWTNDKVDIAKRLCENGYKPKDIAMATGMSLRAAQKFYSDTFPYEVGGQWKEWTVTKRGRKGTDKTEYHNKIIEIIREDRNLTYKQINDRLPQEMRKSLSALSKEISRIKGLKRRIQAIKSYNGKSKDKSNDD